MRLLSLAVVAIATAALLALPATAAAPTVVYDSIPSLDPPNAPSVVSLGNEAYSMDEIGDHIQFAPSANPRTLTTVDVLMVSWACESGAWNLGTCATTSGATFTHPLTLNLYEADTSGSVPVTGALIASKTVTFTIPFRPSSDPTNCPTNPTAWYSPASNTCQNGLGSVVTFDFTADGIALPSELIWGIAYDTRTHGASPIGVTGPYDSLNVGLSTAVTVGADVDPRFFLDSTWAALYYDGAAGGLDSFRYGSIYTTYIPAARFNANELIGPPTDKDQCKKGGWQTFNNPTFKNQGDCVSYVASQGKAKGNP